MTATFYEMPGLRPVGLRCVLDWFKEVEVLYLDEFKERGNIT